jgi:hypothetical protein
MFDERTGFALARPALFVPVQVQTRIAIATRDVLKELSR